MFLGLHGTFLSDINIDMTVVPPPKREGVNADTAPPLSPRRRVILKGTRCSGQGETSCAGSLLSPKEQCFKHRLPASAAPMVFPRRITLQPSSEFTGGCFQLLEAGTKRSGEGLWVVACPNWFRGFYESILNWEKIYCNALMNRYFYLPLVCTFICIYAYFVFILWFLFNMVYLLVRKFDVSGTMFDI